MSKKRNDKIIKAFSLALSAMTVVSSVPMNVWAEEIDETQSGDETSAEEVIECANESVDVIEDVIEEINKVSDEDLAEGDFSEEMESAETSMEEAQELIDDVVTDVEDAESAKNEADKAIDDVSKSVIEATEAIENVNAAVENLSEQISNKTDAAQEIFDEAKTKYDKAYADYENAKSDYEEAITTADKKRSECEAALTDAMTEVEQAAQELIKAQDCENAIKQGMNDYIDLYKEYDNNRNAFYIDETGTNGAASFESATKYAEMIIKEYFIKEMGAGVEVVDIDFGEDSGYNVSNCVAKYIDKDGKQRELKAQFSWSKQNWNSIIGYSLDEIYMYSIPDVDVYYFGEEYGLTSADNPSGYYVQDSNGNWKHCATGNFEDHQCHQHTGQFRYQYCSDYANATYNGYDDNYECYYMDDKNNLVHEKYYVNYSDTDNNQYIYDAYVFSDILPYSSEYNSENSELIQKAGKEAELYAIKNGFINAEVLYDAVYEGQEALGNVLNKDQFESEYENVASEFYRNNVTGDLVWAKSDKLKGYGYDDSNVYVYLPAIALTGSCDNKNPLDEINAQLDALKAENEKLNYTTMWSSTDGEAKTVTLFYRISQLEDVQKIYRTVYGPSITYTADVSDIYGKTGKLPAYSSYPGKQIGIQISILNRKVSDMNLVKKEIIAEGDYAVGELVKANSEGLYYKWGTSHYDMRSEAEDILKKYEEYSQAYETDIVTLNNAIAATEQAKRKVEELNQKIAKLKKEYEDASSVAILNGYKNQMAVLDKQLSEAKRELSNAEVVLEKVLEEAMKKDDIQSDMSDKTESVETENENLIVEKESPEKSVSDALVDSEGIEDSVEYSDVSVDSESIDIIELQSIEGSVEYSAKQEEINNELAEVIKKIDDLTLQQFEKIKETGLTVNVGGCLSLNSNISNKLASILLRGISINITLQKEGKIYSIVIPKSIDLSKYLRADGSLDLIKLYADFGFIIE